MFSNKRQPNRNRDVSPQEMRRLLDAFDVLATRIERLGHQNADAALDDLFDLLTDDERATRRLIEECDAARFSLLVALLPDVARFFASPLILRSIKKLQERRPDVDLSKKLDAAALSCARRLYSVANADAKRRFKSREEALNALESMADDGDPEARFALALRYYFGDGVERDYAKARGLARQAEEQGLRRASILRDLPRDLPRRDDAPEA